jgi:hypothetical protein
MRFPYSFSKSFSFCGFEGLHRLADICRPFRAWSGMGVFILTAEHAEESAEIAEGLESGIVILVLKITLDLIVFHCLNFTFLSAT